MRVAFVVNGPVDCAMGHRARAFAQRLEKDFAISILYREKSRLQSVIRFARELRQIAPHICYVFDMAASGVLAGILYKTWTGSRLIIDTGDAIRALAESLGRGWVGRQLTAGLERVSLATADRIVVRGTYHQQYLADKGVPAEFIPDGVETDQFAPRPAEDLRRKLGLEGMLVVGMVGSMNWIGKLNNCYGWDLVELIRLLRGQPVVGVLIGSGSGVPVLQERCRQYGIEQRVRFLGQMPYEELPAYLSALDVCLSTQTNDLPGRVRTTGKLPLYMASGRYILASKVGEAARVLDESMLVDFQGTIDPDYPGRLAQRVLDLLAQPDHLQEGLRNIPLAREHFDYDRLAGRLRTLLAELA